MADPTSSSLPRVEEVGPEPEASLTETLYELLYRVDLDGRELDRELRALQRVHGGEVYSELIYLLCHLRFDAEQARDDWKKIVNYRQLMERRLDCFVDLRVALVSYFMQVNRQLENPKVIELSLFEQTRQSAYRDELTGLPNYRLFSEQVEQEIHRAERAGTPVTLIMIDVDHFKEYNDFNDHEIGNQALVTIARLLEQSIRKADLASRYGGEEFVLILPSTFKSGAQRVAERARRAIERHPFPGEERQPGGRLTVSMGLATYPADAACADELIRHADRAMYLAKSLGKNRLELYGSSKRSFRRFPATLDGHCCIVSASAPVTTLNLSQRGLLFHCDRNLSLGSIVDVRLQLPGNAEEISAAGRVVRVEACPDSKFETAVSITQMSSSDRARLSQYLGRLARDGALDESHGVTQSPADQD